MNRRQALRAAAAIGASLTAAGCAPRPSPVGEPTPIAKATSGAASSPGSPDAAGSTVRNGSIVSMHCGHAVTIAALGPILDGLHSRGLRIATVSQLVAA
jgi:hypothetical protein